MTDDCRIYTTIYKCPNKASWTVRAKGVRPEAWWTRICTEHVYVYPTEHYTLVKDLHHDDD